MSKKNKLNVVDMALICNALHLDSTQMRKYEKKMHKNAPSRIVNLIEKDDMVFLAVMLGYHIAKMVKRNKKQKKFIANSHKSSKKYQTVKNNPNFAGNTDSLFDLEHPPLGTLPTDINDKAEVAVNTTANIEKPQDKQPDDEQVSKDASSEINYRADPEDLIGKATVSDVCCNGTGIAIAVCMVDDGKLKVNTKAQVIRRGCVVYEGTIAKLDIYDFKVNEVCSGFNARVVIEGFTDYKINDIIDCFEDEPDVDNTNTDKVVPQTDDESLSSQYIVPKYIEGVDFKILVTDVDIDKGKLTYLDLGECSNVTPACASSVLSATNLIGEGNHCEIAGKFGIDLEYVESGVQFIRTELPTKGQIEALKDSDIWRFDTVLNSRIINKPILVDDGSDRDNHPSRTTLMPHGKLEKRQSNWRAVLIPSVTIEF